MHEFSITESILSIALEKAEENRAKRITKINIHIGDLSGIVDECVEFYFPILSKDTIAADAVLTFEKTPTKLHCRECDNTFSPDDIYWVCPGCNSQSVEIVSGRECYINTIEVE